MTALQTIWCVLLALSIITLWLPTRFIDTTCAFMHAGFVCWVVAALFGLAGSAAVGGVIMTLGFLSIMWCIFDQKEGVL